MVAVAFTRQGQWQPELMNAIHRRLRSHLREGLRRNSHVVV